MSTGSNEPKPLALTRSPRLDAVLRFGWEPWARAARAASPEPVAAWLAQRLGDADLKPAVLPTVAGLLTPADPEERDAALLELAELAEEAGDDLLADTLWEGALAAGRDAADPDLIFEATGRLAAIAERHGDPLAAAEFYIEYLNWRRHSGHASDPEDIETAFDEIVRLAEQDGARREAAIYAYRQAGFTRLLEVDDDRTVTGDWEKDPALYQGWS